jgi:hypothetical protein
MVWFSGVTPFNLYISGPSVSSVEDSGTQLSIKGSTVGATGVFTTTTLFTEADIDSSGTMNLYLDAPLTASPVAITNDMNLFTRVDGTADGFNEINAVTTLMVKNAWIDNSGTVPLVMWGPQLGGSGFIPNSGTMNLFISRQFESLSHNLPMFIAGPSGISDDTTPLFIKGVGDTENVTMFVKGVGKETQGLQLYSHGN